MWRGEFSLDFRRRRIIKCGLALAMAALAAVVVGVGLQPKTSAEAANYPKLSIAAINLETPVEPLTLQDGQLIAPATIAGSFSQHQNKTMIIGHLATVFAELQQVEVGDKLTYAGVEYEVVGRQVLSKSEVDMRELLAAAEEPTLVLMTCAGTPLGGQDYSERLVITAVTG